MRRARRARRATASSSRVLHRPLSASPKSDPSPFALRSPRSPADPQGDVNGPDTQPIWKYLKAHAEPPVENIDWNFSKFLVKDGKITWFPAKTSKVVSSYYPDSGRGRGRADRQSDVAAKL